MIIRANIIMTTTTCILVGIIAFVIGNHNNNNNSNYVSNGNSNSDNNRNGSTLTILSMISKSNIKANIMKYAPNYLDWPFPAEKAVMTTQNPNDNNNNKETTTATMMTALVYDHHGDANVLKLRKNDFPRPIPRDDQVLVRVMASSINPVDFKYRRNKVTIPGTNIVITDWILPKPKIPGHDIAGVVVEVGKLVDDGSNNSNSNNNNNPNGIKVGDRVAAMMPLLGSSWGAAAEYAAVKASFVCKLDNIDDNNHNDHNNGSDETSSTTKNINNNINININNNNTSTTFNKFIIDFETAAAIPLAALTAVQKLDYIPKPTAGKKILIHAGAGGVGTFAIQYAKNVLGMFVATTASGSTKANFLKKELGADIVIDYQTQDFVNEIQNYDAVLDTMSFIYEERTLKQTKDPTSSSSSKNNVLKSNGIYLNVLSSDWAFVNGKERTLGPRSIWNYIKHKMANIIFGPDFCPLPDYNIWFVQPDGRRLQYIVDLVKQGKIRVIIDTIYDLEKDAVEAYKKLETGRVTGKIVLRH